MSKNKKEDKRISKRVRELGEKVKKIKEEQIYFKRKTTWNNCVSVGDRGLTVTFEIPRKLLEKLAAEEKENDSK